MIPVLYKIRAYIPSTGRTIDMPKDYHLTMMEGEHRMKLYKRNNPSLTYYLVNEANGDIDWEF